LSQPIFHLLAGPNGAGKSTLYRAMAASGAIESDLEFVNADLHEKDCLQHLLDLQQRSEAAREWADARRQTLLDARAEFVSETVFSHESKLNLIRHAQSLGYQVVLYVVSLDDPQRLLARVSQRVREGGHNVPASRILGRYPRTDWWRCAKGCRRPCWWTTYRSGRQRCWLQSDFSCLPNLRNVPILPALKPPQTAPANTQ